jgi:quercetin dioxygenase-like cupin family protein
MTGPAPEGLMTQATTDAIQYQIGAIVSRQMLKTPNGSVTVFAFDDGEELSEHTSSLSGLLHVLEGACQITVAGETFELRAGEMIALPPTIPHAVKALKQFKMVLVLIRP